MPYFVVPIVKKSKLRAWHDYWNRKMPARQTKRRARRGSLRHTVFVKAKSKAEAANIAEAQNPGFVVIRKAIGHGLK